MSVEITVNVVGIHELQLKLNQLDLAMRSRIDETLTQEVANIQAAAQNLAPKRTGYLASTIYAERTGEWAFRLGAKARYAYFVEFGTRFVQARRFLGQALEQAVPRVVQQVSRAIREVIVEAGGA